ncbi:LOW QUALITY PROTEIN: hypothetical protein HID58_058919 [Brassica napus]|uniref:non-specific serine/threonine protein kinase n=1 Tax=Brassica napus TaxID=3708 RepID=A0ABQ7ZRS4_BRANA|nr:LOW QUALITY PROTEIN: hypothetical protein HID58_058919 [Brassica napus]
MLVDKAKEEIKEIRVDEVSSTNGEANGYPSISEKFGDKDPEKGVAAVVVEQPKHKSLLAYLHELEPKVVHRDIKSSNILIDDKFNSKISDFLLCEAAWR